MVGGAVVSHQTCPVDGKNHVQTQQRHILHQLVEGALQEGGVKGRHRDHPLFGKAARHGNGVLLRDAHIKGPLRKLFHKSG